MLFCTEVTCPPSAFGEDLYTAHTLVERLGEVENASEAFLYSSGMYTAFESRFEPARMDAPSYKVDLVTGITYKLNFRPISEDQSAQTRRRFLDFSTSQNLLALLQCSQLVTKRQDMAF